MCTDTGILLSHMLMNPLCKKLPGLQPEPLHHRILNTIPPASTALWCFSFQRACHHHQCTAVVWNLLRSPHSHHNHACSGRVSCCTTSILLWPTALHMLHHPSYCPGPTPHDCHAFGLLKKPLIGLRFRSKVSRLQWCNSSSSCPGSSLHREPFHWCVRDACFNAHGDDFVWPLPNA